MNDWIGGFGRGGEGLLPPENRKPMVVHIATRTALLNEMARLRIFAPSLDESLIDVKPLARAVLDSFDGVADVRQGQTQFEVIETVAGLLTELDKSLRDPFYRLTDGKADLADATDATEVFEELKGIFKERGSMLPVKSRMYEIAIRSMINNIGPVFGGPRQ